MLLKKKESERLSERERARDRERERERQTISHRDSEYGRNREKEI